MTITSKVLHLDFADGRMVDRNNFQKEQPDRVGGVHFETVSSSGTSYWIADGRYINRDDLVALVRKWANMAAPDESASHARAVLIRLATALVTEI